MRLNPGKFDSEMIFYTSAACDACVNIISVEAQFFPIVLAMALIEYCIEIASFANTEVSSTDSVDAKYCPKQSNLKPAFSFHFQFWLS